MSTTFKATGLSPAAKEVLGQLFVYGPVWDGNVCSKNGRGELVCAGLAFHSNGWASLTSEGVQTAANWHLSELGNYDRWKQKIRQS